MIITEAQASSNSLGLKTVEASVKASAFMYKVYYSSLYERKEEAVIRELSANAWDAHKMASKEDVPITISLPTELDPYLIITDEGIGMSLSDIENIFSVYGESSKSGTNDQIGGFGYGGKSPYSIADTFTITTTQKGITTEVIASMDKGIPVFLIQDKGSIGKSDGTTVSVPVDDAYHIDRLAIACRKVFTYWPVKPKISNLSGDTNNDVDMDKQFDTDFIFENSTTSYFGARKLLSTVVMGNFAYSIPDSIKAVLTDNKEIASFVEIMRKASFDAVLKMPIGALELSPSRERIENTQENQNILLATLLKAISKYDSQAVKFDKENTLQLLEILEKHTYRYELDGELNNIVYATDADKIREEIQAKILRNNSMILYKYWCYARYSSFYHKVNEYDLEAEAYGTYLAGYSVKTRMYDTYRTGDSYTDMVGVLSLENRNPTKVDMDRAFFRDGSKSSPDSIRLYSMVTPNSDFRVSRDTYYGVPPNRTVLKQYILKSDTITSPKLRSFISELQEKETSEFQVAVYPLHANLHVEEYTEFVKKFFDIEVVVVNEKEVQEAFERAKKLASSQKTRTSSTKTAKRRTRQRWETARYIRSSKTGYSGLLFEEFESMLADDTGPVIAFFGENDISYNLRDRLSGYGTLFTFNAPESLYTKSFKEALKKLEDTYPNLLVLENIDSIVENKDKKKFRPLYDALVRPIEIAYKAYAIGNGRLRSSEAASEHFYGVGFIFSCHYGNGFYELVKMLPRATYIRLLGAQALAYEEDEKSSFEEVLTKKDTAIIRTAANKLFKEKTKNDPSFINNLIYHIYRY